MGKDKASKSAKGKGKKVASKAKEASSKSAVESPSSVVTEARAAAFTDESPEKAFAHFLAEAEALPEAEYPVFTGQPLLMRANILRALERMTPHLATAASKLREPRLREVLELPSLVMALEFAASRVPLAKLSEGELDRMLAEGAPWRELLLSYLEVAAHPLLGLVPRERVAAIRAGTGRLDKAQDFVALAGLFAEFAGQLKDRHPFPAASLDRLATLGGTLVQNIRPGRAPSQALKRTAEALLRDRFAALVIERYDHLQVLAAVALGKRQADELLPALRSALPSTPGEDAAESKGDSKPA